MIWHNASKEEVAKELDSQPKKGLTDLNAGMRRSAFGTNTKITPRKRAGFTVFMSKLLSPLSLLLITLSGFSAAVNIMNFQAGATKTEDLAFNLSYAGTLLLAALVSDVVRAAREVSANSTIVDIKRSALTFVRVRRNGIIKEILAEELVPGDIIQIEVGDIIPADGRLLITRSFMCDERVLTGDDTPALKDANAVLPEETPLGQRSNMAYCGTVAVTGRAVMLVTETGKRTLLALKHGKRPRLISNRTPLVRHSIIMRSFGAWLALCTTISVLMIYTLGLDLASLTIGWSEINRFVRSNIDVIPDYLKALQGHAASNRLFDGMLFFLTLAICIVPLGLPQNVMRSIAKGISSLSKKGVMLHRFKKTEIIGSTSVICTDKSGTLTHDRLSVRSAWPAGDTAANVEEGFWSDDMKYLMRCCTLCCDRKLIYNADSVAESFVGDQTDAAIIRAYVSNGGDINELLDKYPRSGEIPFDASRRLMTVIYDVNGVYMTVTKGAPDSLIPRCVNVDNDEINRQAQIMFDEGLKVIAVAVQSLNQLPDNLTPDSVEHDLTFIGLLGLDDPFREDACEEIEVCSQAGIRTVMITGDHYETASALARKLHILEEGQLVMTGEELAVMPDSQLKSCIDRYSVFARVTPEDKVRIIKTWRSKGATVLMTAGGMNDAPALHKADISCSVEGKAADVAVDAADITFSDSSFANISAMIRQGRRIRKNIRNLTEFSLTCTIAQTMLLMVGGFFFGTRLLHLLPLTVLNLLFFLLVQPCFADEPADKNAMRKMPDSNDGKLTGKFENYRSCMAGAYIVFSSVIAFLIGKGAFAVNPVRGGEESVTMAFVTMALGLTLHAFCTRSDRVILAAGLFRNIKMLLSVIMTAAAVVMMVVVPQIAVLMGFHPLNAVEWYSVGGLLLIQLIVWEYPKLYAAVKF